MHCCTVAELCICLFQWACIARCGPLLCSTGLLDELQPLHGTAGSLDAAASGMSMAGSGVDPLGKSQGGFGSSGGGFGGAGSGNGAGGASRAIGGGGGMAEHSRGDEAFMDRSASATLNAHRVSVHGLCKFLLFAICLCGNSVTPLV